MKVLIISNMYPSQKYPTFGIFIENQIKQLSKLGMNVQIIANNDPEMGKWKLLKKYSKWIKQFILPYIYNNEKYDIIHAHYAFPSGAIARVLSKRMNIPYIVTCHGGDLNKMANVNKFIKSETKKILQNAKHIIVVGEDLQEKVINEYDIPTSKVSMFSMGIDSENFYPVPKNEAMAKVDFSKENIHLIYVGNLIKEKGVLDLIEAFKYLSSTEPNLELHFVGAYKQRKFLEIMKEKIRIYNLTHKISFHGAKPYKDLKYWMSSSDIFILPSHTEGFGLVAVEAMACGIPVVGTKTGGLYHLLKGGAGGLATPKSPESLALAISEMLSSKEKRHLAIEKAKQITLQNDSMSIAKEVIRIYEQ